MPRRETYEMIRCENPVCERNLLVSGYSIDRIAPDVERDRIHYVVRPAAPRQRVHCTCGHYTISVQNDREVPK